MRATGSGVRVGECAFVSLGLGETICALFVLFLGFSYSRGLADEIMVVILLLALWREGAGLQLLLRDVFWGHNRQREGTSYLVVSYSEHRAGDMDQAFAIVIGVLACFWGISCIRDLGHRPTSPTWEPCIVSRRSLVFKIVSVLFGGGLLNPSQ